MKKLKHIALYEINLSEIPKEVGELSNLENFYLNYNSLKKLPVEIQNLKKLKILYLNGNLFKDKEPETIKKWLPNCEIVWEVSQTNN